jgi:hypothetical protein
MSWLIRHNGVQFSSDDFTIEDLGEIEKATGTAWSIANPIREIKQARAFLATAMLRSGRSEAEVEAMLNQITLRSLKNAFEYVADEDADAAPEEIDEADPLPAPSLITPGSSHGASDKGGPRPSRKRSA